MTTEENSNQKDKEEDVEDKILDITEAIEPLQEISRINDIKVKKLSFNYKDFEKKVFEKAEKKLKKRICDRIEEWSTFSRQEVIQEVYPCANNCYEAEPLDFNRWKVTCPITSTNQYGRKELKFMKRFRVVLNLVNCDRDSLEVKWWEKENVVLVKGKTKDKLNEEDEEAPGCCRSNGFNFGRKFKLPSRVKIEKIEARLVADDKLILEFPINKLKKSDLATESSDLSPLIESSIIDSSEKLLEAGTSQQEIQRGKLRPQGSKDESSSTTSSCESSSSTGKELKLGVPIFRNDEGLRRLYLTLNVGNEFQPADVMVQVINENRLCITARRRIRNGEKTKKTRFSKFYDLCEKIDPFSLKAGFNCENKLVMTAVAMDQMRNDDEDEL